jgi:L-iditol 2-dehydrogenase
MKAALYIAPYQIEVREDIPEPDFTEGLLVHVKTTGFCSTDVKIIKGIYPNSKVPYIFGHEFSGEVVKSTLNKFKPGERVSVAPFCGCGYCTHCLMGNEQLCKNRTLFSSGTTAEYVAIAPHLAMKTGWVLPDDISWDEAALCEPLACVVLSLRSCNFRPGESVLILGAGVMGQLHVLLAKAWGASQVMISEPSEVRREMARKFGAEVIDPTKCDDVGGWARGLCGEGPDIIIAAAGTKLIADAAIKAAGFNSRIHLFGGMPGDTIISIPAYDIHYRHVTLLGTSGFRSEDYHTAAEMIKSHAIDVGKLITHHYSVDEAMEAFKMAQQPEALKVMLENTNW